MRVCINVCIQHTHTHVRVTGLWHLKSPGSPRSPEMIRLSSQSWWIFSMLWGPSEFLHLVKEAIDYINLYTWVAWRIGMLGERHKYCFALSIFLNCSVLYVILKLSKVYNMNKNHHKLKWQVYSLLYLNLANIFDLLSIVLLK